MHLQAHPDRSVAVSEASLTPEASVGESDNPLAHSNMQGPNLRDTADDSNPPPIGVQGIGGQFHEDTVLAVRQALEDEFGGWQPPPALR